MDRERLERIKAALEAYTDKVTSTSAAAKAALEQEGIYMKDGSLAPEYEEPAAA
ncbi:hypothetical protein LAZ40_13195 [Cereibacter sphaeroides]|uniref:hypothetical protein n=1 Tax=Cereibacter sphaeroides TaxID=1063 RepID=UPI001F256C82|nr:hypothetical protein [Cereibacter sphaeroides]MCE6959977.1 hypothetical protein [Cereibacter sphaeroides]MCE6973062.1 hypothetical protein [Cereibacter sphaeroides]